LYQAHKLAHCAALATSILDLAEGIEELPKKNHPTLLRLWSIL
jgi:hypothetical protein